LLRHAESEGNVARIPQGQDDSPMTALGRLQAKALVNRWEAEGRHFDQIIASPLRRAKEVAELVAERLGAPLEINELWVERVDAHYDNPKFTTPYRDAFGMGSEGQWQLYLRAGQALLDLLNREPGAYLVISHGGLLNALMYAILGLAPQAFGHGPRFRFDNCSISEFTYQLEGHRWLLLRFNDTQHLNGLKAPDG
jgi:broad specificity phosphatase PhoE